MKRTAIITTALLLLATASGASDWGGHYGTIRLVFDPATLDAVTESEPYPEVGAIVDLYAVLTDLEPCDFNGEALNAVGGFELKLAAEGGTWKVLSQELPEKNFNASPEPGTVQAGVFPGLNFRDGSAVLVHWQLQIPGGPHPMTFRLDPAGARSCGTVPDCADSGTYAVWTGTAAAKQHGVLFSAAYTPAYLNWAGEAPAVEPVRGTGSWQERGYLTPR